jgi:uncharacterized LabA/DUF88 family protein
VLPLRVEPPVKRAIAFVDGQNLFFAAKQAFGHTWPNCRFPELANAVCNARGWQLVETRFYTGVPAETQSPHWYTFWNARLLAMSRLGVMVYSRPLRYRRKPVTLPDGRVEQLMVGEEKGIDVRIALDLVTGAFDGTYDVAVIFSEDQDLTEAVRDIKVIAQRQQRWIKVASAFPSSMGSSNRRGIDRMYTRRRVMFSPVRWKDCGSCTRIGPRRSRRRPTVSRSCRRDADTPLSRLMCERNRLAFTA